MAKRRRRPKPSRRGYDVEDLVDFVSRLSEIRTNGGGHAVPLTDPSVNVSKEMDLRASYDREIRNLNEDWQKRFDGERQRANDAKAEKESGRVDSRFAELSTQALTLVQTVATTAKAASDAVAAAALQQAESMNQMREIVSTLGTTVTSLVAAGGSERLTRGELGSETRWSARARAERSQWAIGLAIFGGIAFLGLVLSATVFVSTHISFR